MFEVRFVKGNDNGDELKKNITEMGTKGYELFRIVPNVFEEVNYDKAIKIDVGKIDLEQRVKTYLCVFRRVGKSWSK